MILGLPGGVYRKKIPLIIHFPAKHPCTGYLLLSRHIFARHGQSTEELVFLWHDARNCWID